MCGICGAVDLGDGPVSRAELEPMNDALRLRGPDAEGYHVDGAAGLGHRRLSIIDVGGGHQPMANEDGSVVVVNNGEIYNFMELRLRLAALGHHFRTRSDTEVIAHGYEQWGEQVAHHLDGMFALAVWDARARRLLLARDRFGKKPLVWFRTSGRLVFASTITALLRHPSAPRTVDPRELERYLALEFVPAPRTIISGISKLSPGSVLILNDQGDIARRRYWRLQVRGETSARPETIDKEIRQRVVEATRKRLVSEVPLGVFLSGGVDSSTVVAAAFEAGLSRIRTFSVSFADASFDESAYAREVASRFGAEHVEERLDAGDLLEIVPRVGEILDEPMADASIVPTYLLSRVARRHVTVVLGGDGGDELFAGYPTYVAHRLARIASPLLRGRLLRFARSAAAMLPVSHRNVSFDFKVKTALAGLDAPREVRNYIWLGAFRASEIARLLGRAVDEDALLAPVAEVYRDAPGARHLERVLFQDTNLYLAHQILVKVDRASMSNSLEVRAPLLDTRLVEYVAALPLREKLSGLTGKAALKRAVRTWLPRRVIDRPKKGFGMPIGAWLRGPLQGFARELLLDRDGLAGAGLVDPAELSRLLDEHVAGRVDHRKRLWSLVVLELWRRHHLTPPAAAV